MSAPPTEKQVAKMHANLRFHLGFDKGSIRLRLRRFLREPIHQSRRVLRGF